MMALAPSPLRRRPLIQRQLQEGEVVPVAELHADLREQADFDEAKVAKLSNTLMLMAIGLGVHDSDNAYKANAGAIFKAAEELAKAKGFAAAKTGVDAVKAAVGTIAEQAAIVRLQ